MTELKLFSWNVNGLRAVLKKGALVDFIEHEYPDILCLQEIKCKPNQIDLEKENEIFSDYEIFWNPAEKAGYSGTATLIKKIFLKTQSKNLTSDLETNSKIADGLSEKEGRILVTNLDSFYLINVYTPNSKPNLSRLELRQKTWDPEFLSLLKTLEKEKPVITCGDFNAAHEEIDIARPKTNHHSAGFTDEERQGITNVISNGFLDSFRFKNPTSIRYTWWSHWGKARENNVGWRIDYFFISKSLKNSLTSAEIYEKYFGSDHCPISIGIKI